MKKMNLEKINKELLSKDIHYVEPMSEYKSLAQIHCFDINKSKSEEPNYEKFIVNFSCFFFCNIFNIFVRQVSLSCVLIHCNLSYTKICSSASVIFVIAKTTFICEYIIK